MWVNRCDSEETVLTQGVRKLKKRGGEKSLRWSFSLTTAPEVFGKSSSHPGEEPGNCRAFWTVEDPDGSSDTSRQLHQKINCLMPSQPPVAVRESQTLSAGL